MKNIINILIIAGVVVLAGIIVVVLFLTGILGGGGKSGPTISDPEPVHTTTPSPTPSQTMTPTPTPTPTLIPPSPEPVTPEPIFPSIDAGGGEVRVDGETELLFTPGKSGIWIIYTSDSGDDDPDLTLNDANGREIAYDDDGMGDYNAIIIIQLDAGNTYTIVAGLYGGGDGAFTVSAKPAGVISGGGDTVRANGTSGFEFTPNESGFWEIRTSENDDDPYLELYDVYGNLIDYDDDSGGDYNALIRYEMNAGTTYGIVARNYNGNDGGFRLSVAMSPSSAGAPAMTYGGAVESMIMDVGEGIEFTPDEDGIWIIYTSDEGDADPMLEIYNPDMSLLAEDDDGWGDYNAMLVVFLRGGETYVVVATDYYESSGSFTLNFKSPIRILSTGDIEVINASAFIFTPLESGMYRFQTSDNGYDDPCIDIYDEDADFVGGDDDGADNYNSLLDIYLDAGETYHIYLSFFNVGYGTCFLSVMN